MNDCHPQGHRNRLIIRQARLSDFQHLTALGVRAAFGGRGALEEHAEAFFHSFPALVQNLQEIVHVHRNGLDGWQPSGSIGSFMVSQLDPCLPA